MENVAFTGTKVVTTEITKAQYDQYRQTGKFDYVVDNQKLAESFVKLLNELRELNGVKGNIKADAEFMAYAEARANEMSKNNVLSHDTTIENKPGGAFENAYGSFGAYGQTRIEMVKQSFQCMNQQLMIALHMNYFLGGIQTTQMLQVPTMVTVELTNTSWAKIWYCYHNKTRC